MFVPVVTLPPHVHAEIIFDLPKQPACAKRSVQLMKALYLLGFLLLAGSASAETHSVPPIAGPKSKAADETVKEQPVFETIDLAIAKGDLADVKRHIAADPARAKQGGKPTSRPPLEQAILRNKTDIAEYLLTVGADPNTVNATKRTPLHLAVDRNNPAISSALLKAGANPNLLDQEGWTPLHHAAAKNQFENAKAILAGGAKPTTLSARGGTPLHEAAASGGEEIIRLFLQHGLDPNQKSKEGVTPVDLAKQYKNEAALRVFSEKK
jgi:ankyrin repeat protein